MIKKLLYLVIAVFSLNSFSQTTYVPDDNFEQALIDLGHDTVLDDYVPTNNILYLGLLDLSGEGINDLTGIEDFTGLYYLNVTGNNLTSIDLRTNIALQEFYCSNNQLRSLNLSQNVILNKFSGQDNQLTNLNIQNGNNTNVTGFSAINNPNLTCIQVDDAAYSTANWSSIDVQTSFNLDCGLTFVPDDNFEQALIDLGYDSGPLDDHLPTTNINTITSLNVSNKNITELTGIEDFIALETLVCSNNQLTNIDISQNVALNYFDCNLNQLTSLDVSQNIALTVLACRSNQITSLNLSNNSLLEYFSCHTNLLTDLDVSQNPALLRLWCYNNQLTSLNVKNGANTNITNGNFNATVNPNLACIQIDDLAYSTTNWTNIDAASSFSEDCNATYVPDDNFEQALIDLGYDTVLDNYVTTSNINTITFLNISNKSIADLTGIEDFTMLQTLSCHNNLLTTLNVTANLHLTDLLCFGNQLTNLDVSNNSNLSTLRVENNLLTALNVSQNTALQTLRCQDNQITALDLSLNTDLNRMWCHNNQLTFLNIKNGNNSSMLSTDFKANTNPNLFCIDVDDVAYSTSNWYGGIDSQTSFSEYCNATYVPDDNFEQALIDLGYDTVLDNYVLTTNINTITSLDVSLKSIADLTGIEGFTALTSLQCNNNQLTSLDVSQNTLLTDLICSTNSLGSLDLSQNIALTNLNCQNNDITSINLSQNVALTDLNIKNNLLTSLNVSQNTNLDFLDCRSNQIAILDLSSNTNLTSVNCSTNQLVNLDISNNPLITFLNTSNNLLSSLDVANGNNTIITTFFATGNVNLTCINVDDTAWSTTNWTNIDAQSFFSTDCNVTYVPDDNFEQALIDLGYDTVLDNYVVTNNINTITNLAVNGKNISDLTGIDDFTALTALDCSNNVLTTLDLSQNTALTFLNCKSNLLNSIDITQNTALTFFDSRVNQLTNLDVTNNTLLEFLWCESNQLTNLDVTTNTAITDLRCGINQLTTLDVSQNLALEMLVCSSNQLTNINLGNNTVLTTIWCNNNQLTNLSLSQNTALTTLHCTSNSISNLDVSLNTNLLLLYCENNQLTNINVGNNTNLTNFIASNNQLTNIDITANTAIAYFYVENNSLTSLNLKNGNNINMFIRAWGNPNLTCIEVDDTTWSNANWTTAIDATASFSEDCVLGSIIIELKAFLQGAYTNPIAGETTWMRDNLRTGSLIPTTSPYTDALTVNVSVFTLTGANAIVDWVWVELRDENDNTNILSSTSALLQRDGDVVATDGISPISFSLSNGNYYVAVSHRNHLGILSANTIALSSTPTNLDLSNNIAIINGGSNAVVNINGIYCMYAGDFDGNDQIQNTDVSQVVNQLGNSGYSNADTDLNGQTQNTDINILINPNIGRGQQYLREQLNLYAKRMNRE